MGLGVFVLPDLDADLRDAEADLIQEPQQSVVVYRVCGEGESLFISAGKRPERDVQVLKQTTPARPRGRPSVC